MQNKGLIMSLNIAVVGLGYWGPNLLRNLYELHCCNRLVACDLDEKKLTKIKSRYPSIETEMKFQKILEDQNIHSVVVATPVSSHYPLAKQALQANKHVFVEKPFTASKSEAEELIELSKQKKKVIMVGHTFEYSPPVLKIKEIIQNGELGEIYYISSSRVNLGLHQKDVSVIWDLAPHDFSCIFYWLDKQPIRVSTLGKDYVQSGIPDVAFVNLEFSTGCIANVQLSWLAPSKLRRTTIVGSKKMLVYDDTENFEKVKIYDKGVNYKDPETFGEYQLSYRSGDVLSPKLDSFEPLKKEMEHFTNCCKNNETPKTDGENGLRVVKTLEAAEYSMRNNGLIVDIDND
jgi:predicted dehydrogenase